MGLWVWFGGSGEIHAGISVTDVTNRLWVSHFLSRGHVVMSHFFLKVLSWYSMIHGAYSVGQVRRAHWLQVNNSLRQLAFDILNFLRVVSLFCFFLGMFLLLPNIFL
jgi:hypothetical protein